jgi:hypothetical protein
MKSEHRLPVCAANGLPACFLITTGWKPVLHTGKMPVFQSIL